MASRLARAVSLYRGYPQARGKLDAYSDPPTSALSNMALKIEEEKNLLPKRMESRPPELLRVRALLRTPSTDKVVDIMVGLMEALSRAADDGEVRIFGV